MPVLRRRCSGACSLSVRAPAPQVPTPSCSLRSRQPSTELSSSRTPTSPPPAPLGASLPHPTWARNTAPEYPATRRDQPYNAATLFTIHSPASHSPGAISQNPRAPKTLTYHPRSGCIVRDSRERACGKSTRYHEYFYRTIFQREVCFCFLFLFFSSFYQLGGFSMRGMTVALNSERAQLQSSLKLHCTGVQFHRSIVHFSTC